MGQISRVVVPGKPFQPNMFVCKVGAYPSEARFLTHLLITIVNTFIGTTPADCPVIFLQALFTNGPNKLNSCPCQAFPA
jgi:hypothetical protein